MRQSDSKTSNKVRSIVLIAIIIVALCLIITILVKDLIVPILQPDPVTIITPENTAQQSTSPDNNSGQVIIPAANTPSPVVIAETPAPATPVPTVAVTPPPTQPPVTQVPDAYVQPVVQQLSAFVAGSTYSRGYEVTTRDANASSLLYENMNNGTYIHYADNTRDRNLTTCWSEGANGNGENEWIQLEYSDDTYISGFTLYLGFWKTQELWSANARPAQLRISFSGGEEVCCDFPDQMTPFAVELSRSIKTSYVRFTVTKTYSGKLYKDCCISEIMTTTDRDTSCSPHLSISGAVMPTNLIKGRMFTIQGYISADYGLITDITCTISNSSGAVLQRQSVSPDSFSYSLADSEIDNGISFGKLSPGQYNIAISAKCVNGTYSVETKLINTYFTVQ